MYQSMFLSASPSIFDFFYMYIMSLYIYIYLTLSISTVHLPVYGSVDSIHPAVCWSIYWTLCLSLHPSSCFTIYLQHPQFGSAHARLLGQLVCVDPVCLSNSIFWSLVIASFIVISTVSLIFICIFTVQFESLGRRIVKLQLSSSCSDPICDHAM